MSLYSDLTEVLTPYANRIKSLNGSVANLPYVTVTQKSDMTNTKLIYKFDGDLYYYDGAAWQKIAAERTQYRDYGDLYTDIFSVAEITEMRIADRQIVFDSNTNTGSSSYRANTTIHFIDPALITLSNVIAYPKVVGWSNFYIFDQNENTYTLLDTLPNINKVGSLRFSAITEGCYLAVASTNTGWKAGIVLYFSKLYLNNAGYKPKFPGLDEPITNGLVPITISNVKEANRYSWYSIDLGEDYKKYNYCLFRPFSNNGASYNLGFFAGDSPNDFSTTLGSWTFGTFNPYYHNKRYINIMDRNNAFTSSGYNISLGWINPKVAAEQKRLHYWGPDLAAHNADLKSLLILSAATCKIIDIDLSPTLDGYFVAKHGTDKINNLNPHEVNLEDLEIEGTNYYEVSEALEIMKKYNSFPYYNFNNGATLEERANLYERTYRVLGDVCIVPADMLNTSSPLYGHCGKYYIWGGGSDVDAIVAAGADIHKVLGGSSPSGQYTKHDYIGTGAAQHITSAESIPKDGSCSLFFMYDDMDKVLNG